MNKFTIILSLVFLYIGAIVCLLLVDGMPCPMSFEAIKEALEPHKYFLMFFSAIVALFMYVIASD